MCDEILLPLNPPVRNVAFFRRAHLWPCSSVEMRIKRRARNGLAKIYKGVADRTSSSQIHGQIEEIVQALESLVDLRHDHLLRIL